MTKRAALLCAMLIVFAAVAIGYVRLPHAAIKGLSDYRLLADKGSIYATRSGLDVSPIQAWWLRTRMRNLSEGDSLPRIDVSIKWNLLFLARVKCGHYIGPVGAEGRDTLYLWLLGFWMPVYDFAHEMA